MKNAATQYPTRRSLRESDKARQAAERENALTARPDVTARQTEKMWHSEMGR